MYQILMLYTLNILQFYLPILSQRILPASHYAWHLIYICWCLEKKNFEVSTEKGKMETFLMLKYLLSKRIYN